MYRKRDCLRAALALGLASAVAWGAPALAIEDTTMADEQIVVQDGGPAEGAFAEEQPGGDDAGLVGQAAEKSGICGTCSWSVDSSGTLVIRPTSGSEGTLPDYSKSDWPWNKSGVNDSMRSVRFEGTVHAQSCKHLFMLENAETIDLRGLDTSQVTDMSYMFSNCHSLKSLDLRPLDTSRVTNMNSMFYFDFALTTIDFTDFDTSQVTDMGRMFDEALNIKSLDLSSFDTSKATNMVYMFGEVPHHLFWELKVGDKYDIDKEGAFPMTNRFNRSSWWSTKLGGWIKSKKIVQTRNHVADTYLCQKPEGAGKSFPDVAADVWYADVVGRAADSGLINGYKDGRFGPADFVTRGQVAVILWNMAEKPAPSATPKSFPDVAAGKYYYDAVRWASSAGVVSGYGSGKFGPDDLVTREQLAVMIANYAHGKGLPMEYQSMKDADKVSSWARSAVGWCFRNKIISGTTDGYLNPQGKATRAETAKMVVLLYDLL